LILRLGLDKPRETKVLESGPTISIPDLDIVGIALIITALGVILALLRGGNRFFRKANQVLDDWNGKEADGGHDAQPGVIQHFHSIDATLIVHSETQERLETKIDEAIHELTTNKGGSLKDAVNRIELQQHEEIRERRVRQDAYDRDQRRTRLEWTAVFHRIEEIFPLSPAEQLAAWRKMTAEYAANELIHPEDTDSTL
jgi:hypothetical protein